MPRDYKGRFTKSGEDGMKLIFAFPSINKILLWILIIGILMPWISIITKLDLPKKLLSAFDKLINSPVEDSDKSGNSKKNGLFK